MTDAKYMVRRTNKEEKVVCPVDSCSQEAMKRGLFMHIYQTDDAKGQGHYPRGEIPPNINREKIKVTGKSEIELDYPETQELETVHYLDTYTGKAYEGKRGLMIHLGQKAGQDNIPKDVTKRHRPDDFPIVDIDDDGNITEVIKHPTGDVPPIEPYLPWFTDSEDGYVSKRKVKQFVEKIRNSPTKAASADVIEEELL